MEVRTTAVAGLKSACTMYLKDLQALPESAFTQSFGPKVRTVADFTHEVILVNDHIGMVLRGETPFDWPDGGWITAPADFDTKEKVVAAFEASTAKIIATAEAFTEEDMGTKIETENGETTCFERLRFMTLHIWYHAGQLNFIQTLLGDDVWHWG